MRTAGPLEIRYGFNIFANGRLIASCGGHSSSRDAEKTDQENRDNAAFIVKAWGLHDELVAALKAIEQRANESGTGEIAERETIYAVYKIARAILAKAEEEL